MTGHRGTGWLVVMVVGAMAACGSKEESAARESPKSTAPAPYVVDVAYRLDSDKDAAINRAVVVVRARLQALGVHGEVRRQGDLILVSLPAMDTQRNLRVRQLIRRGGRLELKLVDEVQRQASGPGTHEPHPLMRRVYQHVATDPAAKQQGVTGLTDFWQGPNGDHFYDYAIRAPDRTVLSRYLTRLGDKDKSMRPDAERELGYEYVYADSVTSRPYWRTYLLRRAVEVGPEHVSNARAIKNKTTGRPEVEVTFTEAGKRRVARLTAANVGKKMAIILDGTIQSAPLIQSAIPGGKAIIHMGGRPGEDLSQVAADLATAINAGSLPRPLTEVFSQPAPR